VCAPLTEPDAPLAPSLAHHTACPLPSSLTTHTACTFRTEAEALQLANDTEFGLGAGVISADEERCRWAAGGGACCACRAACRHQPPARLCTPPFPAHSDPRFLLAPVPRRVSEALEAGIVWVNCSQPCFCQAPWGGIKNSGFGRELGTFGLESFLSVKQVRRLPSLTSPAHQLPPALHSAHPPAPPPPPPAQITTYTSAAKWDWFPERPASPRL
jgi:hypothetical protein